MVRDLVTGKEGEVRADVVVNACGPWSGRMAALAGVDVPMRPSPGVLLALQGRLCHMILNRMHKSGDGDIIVPQRGAVDHRHDAPGSSRTRTRTRSRPTTSRACTRRARSWSPRSRTRERRAAWSSVRPLVGSKGEGATGRELSRTFKVFDHAERDGVEGFVTVTGGKGTTLRAMAERGADVVCAKLGIDEPCRTRETVLLPHSAYYSDGVRP